MAGWGRGWPSDLGLSFLVVDSIREIESERDLVSVCKIKATTC